MKQGGRKSKSEVIQQVSITHLPSIRHYCGRSDRVINETKSLCSQSLHSSRETDINEIGKVYSMSDTYQDVMQERSGQEHHVMRQICVRAWFMVDGEVIQC